MCKRTAQGAKYSTLQKSVSAVKKLTFFNVLLKKIKYDKDTFGYNLVAARTVEMSANSEKIYLYYFNSIGVVEGNEIRQT